MAKVETDFKALFKKFDRFQRTALNALNKPLQREIVSTISKGISPVLGQGKYTKYSDSYKKAIKKGRLSRFSKRRSPVNLRLSGQMLSSIFGKKEGRKLVIGFKDKKAQWHNDGEGNLPRRAMLPQDNETFSRSITLRLAEVIGRVAGQIFR